MSRRFKTPTTLQMEALECGAASLSMILAYYKVYVPLEELRVQCGVSRDGTKASSLVQVAGKYGLHSRGFKMDIPSLKELKKPAIIFWNFNHFVVYEGTNGKKFYLNDPAVGHRTVEFSEFDDSFTGIVLTFEKTPEFRTSGTRPTIWRGLRKRTLGLKSTMSFFVLLSVMFFIPGFITPTFQRFFIDEILVPSSMNLLKPFIVGLAISALINGVLTALQGASLLRFQTKLSLSSASKFVEHILKMPLEFFVQRLPGELCNRISSTDVISQFISGRLVGVAINIVGSIFFFILMLLYDVSLTLIILFFTIVLCVLFLVSSNRVKNKTFKIEMESGKMSGITMSGIDLIESIKASGSENDFFQQWAGQQTVVIQETQNLFKANTSNSIAPDVISSVLDILVLTMGALRIMDGYMTIGMLLAYQTLVGNFMSPVMSLVELGKEILAINADMQRVDDVMDYPAPVIFQDDYDDKDKLKGTNKGNLKNVNQRSNREVSKTQMESIQQDFEPIKKLDGYISIKNLMFKYNILTDPVIQDFNLELTPGKRVALVGGSGSGKSTLGKLLCALYHPLEGEITYDGKKLSEIQRRVFSASVAVVSQNITLFQGSIKDNITMWDKTVPEEVYIQAAKDACIHKEIIERPEGYYTELVEGGTNFSGGQRQRLEIARALAGNPRIIIMDEATSALDPVTELAVDQNIRRRGCTCIIIAHRLSTIRDCDEIIVLDRGRIVQRGRHNQLVQDEAGLYKKLIQNM